MSKYVTVGALIILTGLTTCFTAYIAVPVKSLNFFKIFLFIFIIFGFGLWLTDFLANKINEDMLKSVKNNVGISERIRDRVTGDLSVGTQHRLSRSEIVAIGNFCKVILEDEFSRMNYTHLKWHFRVMFFLQLILLIFIVAIGCS